MPFSYYGSKSKVIKKYPHPQHDLIIEPFAGAGNYARIHGIDRDVILVDKYEPIIRMWKWIQNASLSDLEGLPELSVGDRVSAQTKLSDIEALVLRWNIASGSYTGRDKVSPQSETRIKCFKNRCRPLIGNISHWQIIHGTYHDIENQKATWFIDPPYQQGGQRYKENKIDFDHLAKWCRSRTGEVIVCENEGGKWLPFQPLTSMRGCRKTTVEHIWHNSST